MPYKARCTVHLLGLLAPGEAFKSRPARFTCTPCDHSAARTHSMTTLSRVLAADTAGAQFYRAHEYANYALGVATPLAILSKKDGFFQRVADLGLLFAIPVHMHIGMNACITDYLPKVARAPARAGMLGLTAMTVVGLLKINTTGLGITQTVKSLWHKPSKAAPPAKKK